MTKRLKKWELIGFVFVVVLGALGHFLYEWTGQKGAVGKIFPVNESTWEHLKLLFFPYVIFTIIQWFYIGKNYRGFIFAKFTGALLGMLLIVVLFYTYTGVIGYSVDFLNILIFIISVAFAFYVSFKMLSGNMKTRLKVPSLTGFIIIAVLFVAFTENPPKINLFKDPVTGGFGTESTADTFGYPEYKMELL